MATTEAIMKYQSTHDLVDLCDLIDQIDQLDHGHVTTGAVSN